MIFNKLFSPDSLVPPWEIILKKLILYFYNTDFRSKRKPPSLIAETCIFLFLSPFFLCPSLPISVRPIFLVHAENMHLRSPVGMPCLSSIRVTGKPQTKSRVALIYSRLLVWWAEHWTRRRKIMGMKLTRSILGCFRRCGTTGDL